MHEVAHHEDGFDGGNHHRHDEVSLTAQIDRGDRHGKNGEENERPKYPDQKRHRRGVAYMSIVMPASTMTMTMTLLFAVRLGGGNDFSHVCSNRVGIMDRDRKSVV